MCLKIQYIFFFIVYRGGESDKENLPPPPPPPPPVLPPYPHVDYNNVPSDDSDSDGEIQYKDDDEESKRNALKGGVSFFLYAGITPHSVYVLGVHPEWRLIVKGFDSCMCIYDRECVTVCAYVHDGGERANHTLEKE